MLVESCEKWIFTTADSLSTGMASASSSLAPRCSITSLSSQINFLRGLRDNRMLVTKALSHDVTVLAFVPFFSKSLAASATIHWCVPFYRGFIEKLRFLSSSIGRMSRLASSYYYLYEMRFSFMSNSQFHPYSVAPILFSGSTANENSSALFRRSMDGFP